ncbi:MAG TPA: sulfatase [Gemmataceae bacterium]|nr:sulfatase [Gemmataceae bacterium]
MIRTITRRRFLAGAATLASSPALARPLRSSSGKRNVILIISDTMRRDALGCFGGHWIHTPHLDAFARQAVRLNNAFLCSFPTVCTRHDILTGRYTFTYKPWSPLDRDTVTLQDVLRGAGVYTALVVDTPHPFRTDYNYQRNCDHIHINRGQENDRYETRPLKVKLPCDPHKLRDGTRTVTQYLRNVAGRKVEEDYFCARTMRDAATWLKNNHRRQPFFLYIDTFDPHEPWDPPRSYVEKYDPGYTGENVIYPRYDHWKDFLSPRELRHCRALYAGEASMVDRWAGHLLATIERLNLLENTLVLFVADHGFYLGEHGYIGKSFIRGNRFQSLPLYSQVCRVPMLAHYPGCRPGSANDALVQLVGIAPTILDFLGVKAPASFAAASLWPVLQGKEAKVADIAISSPTLSDRAMKRPQPSNRASITDGRWLLIYGSAGSGDANDHTASVDSRQRLVAPLTGERLTPELFDLRTDPGCEHNVIEAHRDLARDLHGRFLNFLRHSPMRKDHVPFFARI